MSTCFDLYICELNNDLFQFDDDTRGRRLAYTWLNKREYACKICGWRGAAQGFNGHILNLHKIPDLGRLRHEHRLGAGPMGR